MSFAKTILKHLHTCHIVFSFCFCYCYRSIFIVLFQAHTVEFAPVMVLLQHIKIAIVITNRHAIQPGLHVTFQLWVLHTSIFTHLYSRLRYSATHYVLAVLWDAVVVIRHVAL